MDRLDSWNLHTNHVFLTLSAPQQFESLAFGYLDSALELCGSLISNPHVISFERCAVVLYLSAHAVELFLKGAIRRKRSSEGYGHALEPLYKRYMALYPKKCFKFTELPFVIEQIESCVKNFEQNKFDYKKPNELYRYPRNKNGDSMGVLIGFEANSFLRKLNTLRIDFVRIVNEYDLEDAPS